jgi:hypothetical protein
MVRRCQRNEIEKDEKRIDRDRRFIVNFGEAAESEGAGYRASCSEGRTKPQDEECDCCTVEDEDHYKIGTTMERLDMAVQTDNGPRPGDVELAGAQTPVASEEGGG